MVLNPISRVILATTVSALGLISTTQAEQMPPEKSLAGLEYQLIGRSDIYSFKALDNYSEAPFLTEMVKSGALPPVEQRLPKTPLVFNTDAMSDGIGEYGGVFRHVIGGRPEGWNWMAGQHQGWGGINMAMQECLVRQGPRWQVRGSEQTGALPNLAKSWNWNDDKTELTMHLLEGVKWSDRDAFDTEDIRFWWEDNVEDENVGSRLVAGTLAPGATLKIIDEHSFTFSFAEPQSEALVESLAYIQGCPGPSHVLKKNHPKYNDQATYESYATSQPNDVLSPVVLGAWVPVEHKPDELVIMRRNPYYFKVDENGQQLPYYNEMHFRLSTWGDRTAQAVAGTGDFSNMENPGNYVEALKQSQSDDSPVKANFGPRVLSWRLDFNYNINSTEDEYDRALRSLFREKDFRLALSYSLDRDAIGQAVARGPFSYPYIAGFATGSPYYDPSSSEYHPYDLAKSKSLLDGLGLIDTDDNGIRNLSDGGEDITLEIQYDSSRNEEQKQLDAMISMFADVGIRTLLRGIDNTTFTTVRTGGSYTALFQRQNIIVPTRQSCETFPTGDGCPYFNNGTGGEVERLDFESKIAEAYLSFIGSADASLQVKAANDIQALMTENVYTLGTIQMPAALLVNKRIKNAHPGTPVFMYEWAEDGVIRERLWTPSEDQLKEILPGQIAQY